MNSLTDACFEKTPGSLVGALRYALVKAHETQEPYRVARQRAARADTIIEAHALVRDLLLKVEHIVIPVQDGAQLQVVSRGYDQRAGGCE